MFNFPITIAMSQCFVACLVLIGPMFYFEDPTFNNFLKDSYEVLYVEFYQVELLFITNIYISPAPAAIVFTGRCFAAILAWLIFDQFLNEIKILGIFLILAAVIFSQLMPIYDKKNYGRD